MTFKKKPPKPPKATLDDLLQSGAVKTGVQLAKDAEAKAKQAAKFDHTVQDELSNRGAKRAT
jgi:hypothetical protein